jgi:mRNA interferase MazF
MRKGEIHWANLGEPSGNEPGYRRPVLVIQSDLFNGSAIPTVIVVPLTGNLALAKAPGNVKLSAKETGLPKNPVVNVSAIMTINRFRLDGIICEIDPSLLFTVDNGIRLALDV